MSRLRSSVRVTLCGVDVKTTLLRMTAATKTANARKSGWRPMAGNSAVITAALVVVSVLAVSNAQPSPPPTGSSAPPPTPSPSPGPSGTATPCRRGYIVDNGACTPCPPGSSSSGGSATACTICPKGTHNGQWGGLCERCPWNTFARGTNSSSCDTCPSLSWQGIVSPPGRRLCRQIIPDAFAMLLLLVHACFLISGSIMFLCKTDRKRKILFLGSVAPRMAANIYSTVAYIVTAFPSGTERVGFALLFPNPAFFFVVILLNIFSPDSRRPPVLTLAPESPYPKAGALEPRRTSSTGASDVAADTSTGKSGSAASGCCCYVLRYLAAPITTVVASVAYTTYLMAFEPVVTSWRRVLPGGVPSFAMFGHVAYAQRAEDLNLLVWNVVKLATTLLSVLPNLGLAIYVIVDSAASGEDFTDYILQVGKVILSGLLFVKLVAEWMYRVRVHDIHPLHMDPTLTMAENWGKSTPPMSPPAKSVELTSAEQAASPSVMATNPVLVQGRGAVLQATNRRADLEDPATPAASIV